MINLEDAVVSFVHVQPVKYIRKFQISVYSPGIKCCLFVMEIWFLFIVIRVQIRDWGKTQIMFVIVVSVHPWDIKGIRLMFPTWQELEKVLLFEL